MTHEPKDKKQDDDPYAMQHYKAKYGNAAYHEWLEQQEEEQEAEDASYEQIVGELVNKFMEGK